MLARAILTPTMFLFTYTYQLCNLLPHFNHFLYRYCGIMSRHNEIPTLITQRGGGGGGGGEASQVDSYNILPSNDSGEYTGSTTQAIVYNFKSNSMREIKRAKAKGHTKAKTDVLSARSTYHNTRNPGGNYLNSTVIYTKAFDKSSRTQQYILLKILITFY